MESIEPILLTVRQAQGILNIGRNKMYELVNSKEVPSVRIGRCIRIPKRALEEWATGQRTIGD